MTYCIALRLDAGIVFLADSRTNAGVDQVSTFRKMTVFENPGERLMVLLSAGNLAITQSVRQIVSERTAIGERTVWNARSMVEAARVVGDAIREVHERDAEALKASGIEFTCSFLFGGQVRGSGMRLFQLYAAGNFIEATAESLYFQIGESKYGKPIVDRIVTPATALDVAAKCALISMDSTLRSNVSVGLPLDLLLYEADALRVTKFVQIDQNNQYMAMIRNTWGARLKQVFEGIPDPSWRDAPDHPDRPRLETDPTSPVRAPLPASLAGAEGARPGPVQLVAQTVPTAPPR